MIHRSEVGTLKCVRTHALKKYALKEHVAEKIVVNPRSTLLMTATAFIASSLLVASTVHASDKLPIADAHIHYSHDSVELTPPERVIELMREANLKFALVSSSDDNGTQLLSELAPDLIVPGLRPYRRRGETQTWFTDQSALEYVEALLEKNTYASIGEFHLYGDNAELDIPRRIVELADQYNLILHAHSDADAVERLLAQSDKVKVIWAHSGFDDPDTIAQVLAKHDRLWADLAFRSEVGSGGTLSDEWRALFEAHPDRLMLGTDTYTPERMYFLPEHAAGARVWLETLPADLAQNIAWENAYNLIMPVWEANQKSAQESARESAKSAESKQTEALASCDNADEASGVHLQGERYKAILTPINAIEVSKATSVNVTLCGDIENVKSIELDASMPAHGHGTNYKPTVTPLKSTESEASYQVDGLVMHMPGNWRWEMQVLGADGRDTLMKDFMLE